jgi:hypothetical protein
MKMRMAYLLIIAGLISLVSGVFMLTKSEELAKNATYNVENVAGLSESEKKGKDFEEFVVKRLKKNKYFTLEHWRSDKTVDGIFPESNRYPDLKFRFNLHDQQDFFAIECKWRGRAHNGKIEWAKKHQLEQYQKYSKDKNVPVFIIIGVGDSPDDPKHLYVIPLKDIKSHILYDSDIKKYLKTDNRGFYWKIENKTLS